MICTFLNLPNVTLLSFMIIISVYLSDKATLFVWEKSYYCKAMCYMINFCYPYLVKPQFDKTND